MVLQMARINSIFSSSILLWPWKSCWYLDKKFSPLRDDRTGKEAAYFAFEFGSALILFLLQPCWWFRRTQCIYVFNQLIYINLCAWHKRLCFFKSDDHFHIHNGKWMKHVYHLRVQTWCNFPAPNKAAAIAVCWLANHYWMLQHIILLVDIVQSQLLNCP